MKVHDRTLLICESLLEEMELEQIRTSSALLRCLRIARLLHDAEAMQWLRLEHGGYPRDPDGSVPARLEEIARAHGRAFQSSGTERVFYSLASELEKRLEGYRHALKKHLKDETGLAAETDGNFRNSQIGAEQIQSSIQILNRAAREQRQLMSLNSAYYSYALRKYTEISAGSLAGDIFDRYRMMVDHAWDRLGEPAFLSMEKMISVMEKKRPDNSQKILQICRDLIGQILERNLAAGVSVNSQTAAEIRLLQRRLDIQFDSLMRGKELTNADIYGSIIRTYIGAAELLLGQGEE